MVTTIGLLGDPPHQILRIYRARIATGVALGIAFLRSLWSSPTQPRPTSSITKMVLLGTLNYKSHNGGLKAPLCPCPMFIRHSATECLVTPDD